MGDFCPAFGDFSSLLDINDLCDFISSNLIVSVLAFRDGAVGLWHMIVAPESGSSVSNLL